MFDNLDNLDNLRNSLHQALSQTGDSAPARLLTLAEVSALAAAYEISVKAATLRNYVVEDGTKPKAGKIQPYLPAHKAGRDWLVSFAGAETWIWQYQQARKRGARAHTRRKT